MNFCSWNPYPRDVQPGRCSKSSLKQLHPFTSIQHVQCRSIIFYYNYNLSKLNCCWPFRTCNSYPISLPFQENLRVKYKWKGQRATSSISDVSFCTSLTRLPRSRRMQAESVTGFLHLWVYIALKDAEWQQP